MRARDWVDAAPRALAVAAVACATLGSRTTAQDAVRFERLPDELGLSHSSVYAIAQDRAGFLWVGTADGLNRFDGYGFRVFRHRSDDSTSLSSNLVWDLHLDRTGVMWVATSRGIDRYLPEEERFHRYRFDGHDTEAPPQSRIFEDSHERLWLANQAGLFLLDREKDRFQKRQLPGVAEDVAVTALGETPDGHVWAAAFGSGAWLIDLDNERRITIPKIPWIGAFHADSRGDLWLGPDFFTTPPAAGEKTEARSIPVTAWEITMDAAGIRWFATSVGVFRQGANGVSAQRHLLDPTESSQLSNLARSVFVDGTGTLWVGTQGGLFRSDPHAKPFFHLVGDRRDPARLSGSAVSGLYMDTEGNTWVATFGQGLNRVDGRTGAIERFRHRPEDPASLPVDWIWSIHGDPQGRIWIGTTAGLSEFDPRTGRFRAHPLLQLNPRLSTVRKIMSDREGRLWLAGVGILSRYDPRTGRSEIFVAGADDGAGPSHPELSAIAVGEDGSMWFGAGGSRLDRFDPVSRRFQSVELRTDAGVQPTGEGIWDIYPDADGAIWVGTGSGLGRFDPATGSFSLLTTEDGLPGSVVFSMEMDGSGRLWLGTNQGLSRYDDAAPEGSRFRNFNLADGIGSLEFNRGAVLKTPEGELIFGGMNGLTRFSPGAIRENPMRPPVVITRVTTASDVGEQDHLPAGLSGLELPWRENTVSFEFSALSFTNSAQNRYQVRLEPFEREWVDMGSTRHSRYQLLPPGDYVFSARGTNNDGLWSTEPAAVAFTINPPLWATWWFRALVVALVVVSLIAAYRYRVTQLLAVERMRMRIAGDLHDDLSSNLSGIALMGDMLGRSGRLGEDDRRRLSKISNAARGMVDDVRDLVWVVDAGHDTLEDLSLRMKDAAMTLLSAHEYHFDTNLAEARETLPLEFRRHAYLAFKEMLHNVVRHADATRVAISATATDGVFRLSIQDDGTGFDAADVDLSRKFTSLRRRATELNGEMEVHSRAGEGTNVTLTAPLP